MIKLTYLFIFLWLFFQGCEGVEKDNPNPARTKTNSTNPPPQTPPPAQTPAPTQPTPPQQNETSVQNPGVVESAKTPAPPKPSTSKPPPAPKPAPAPTPKPTPPKPTNPQKKKCVRAHKEKFTANALLISEEEACREMNGDNKKCLPIDKKSLLKKWVTCECTTTIYLQLFDCACPGETNVTCFELK